jgi:hypothetical protein
MAYHAILGRSVDQEGLENYLYHLHSGVSRKKILNAIVSSDEANRYQSTVEADRDWISTYYKKQSFGFFNKSVKCIDFDFVMNRLDRIESLVYEITQSDTIYANMKPINSFYDVIAGSLYQGLCGRSANINEINGVVNELKSGSDLSKIIDRFLSSEEVIARFKINEQINKTLDYSPLNGESSEILVIFSYKENQEYSEIQKSVRHS